MKICSICKKEKELDEFYKKTTSKDGYGYRCKKCDVEQSTRWSRENREKSRAHNKKTRETRKLKVLTYYSKYTFPKCSCIGCNVTEIPFLSIDHIENGAAHKKTLTGQSNAHLYGWLVKNNFPNGFQVLCMNCNLAKRINKECQVHAPNKEDIVVFYKDNLLGNRIGIEYANN